MKHFLDLKRNLKTDVSAFPELKVSLLGDTATQFLADALRGEAIERGFRLNLYEADYDSAESEILNLSSGLYVSGAAYTIIFQSTHKLLEKYSVLSPSERDTLADERLAFIRTVCENVRGRIICYNYPEIGDGVFGGYANKVRASFTYQTRKLNYELMNLAVIFPDLYVCDLCELQACYGRKWMFDSSIYVSTEIVLSIDALPYVASRTMDVICSVEGQFKKCLVLDLDNVVWGGEVGEVGWVNVQIGHGLGIGKAFTEFQRWVRKLKERGIIICVSSKNDETRAKEPFEKNPEMVLKMEDIAVFMANWDSKADNIRRIREILNIGFGFRAIPGETYRYEMPVCEYKPQVCFIRDSDK